MAKLLKPLVIVLLVLSIAALVLGVMLFNEREVIKGRTQRLEDAAMQIAGSLQYDDVSRQQLMDYDRMQSALNRLNSHAGVTIQNLEDTRQDLENTRLDLEETREELQVTQSRLEAAEQRADRFERDLETRTSELARANQDVQRLEREKGALQSRVDDFEIQVARMEEEQLELREQITDQQALIEEYEEELFRDDTVIGTPEGLTANIVVVKEDWNFVVIDVGSEDGLSLNTEMLVHRDDELVGRIRITAVKDVYAIADILRDWEQETLKEGDHVLF